MKILFPVLLVAAASVASVHCARMEREARGGPTVHKKQETFEDDKNMLHEELSNGLAESEKLDEKDGGDDGLPHMIGLKRPNVSKLMGILHSANNKILPHLADKHAVKAPGKQLYDAARTDHIAIIEKLLTENAGLKPDSYKDRNGWTALCWAAHHGKVEEVKLLVKHGANINHVSNKQMSPLMLASSMGEIHTVNTIIELGGNVNAVSSMQATPLIYATSTRNHEVMKILLSNGADKDAKIASGKTALDIAKSKHDATAIKILENDKRVLVRGSGLVRNTKKN